MKNFRPWTEVVPPSDHPFGSRPFATEGAVESLVIPYATARQMEWKNLQEIARRSEAASEVEPAGAGHVRQPV